MSELRELYQQVILDHNKTPRNFGALEGANRHQEGFNPLCGDHLHVYLHLDDGEVIEGISFEGSGCAISRASASLMTEALKGKPVAEAMELYKRISGATAGTRGDDYWQAQLRMLQILDRTGRNTHRIAPHIERLRQKDRELGGERFRREFERLQAQHS